MDRPRFSLLAEWYQEEAGMVRPLLITYFPLDNEIEVYDQRCKRMFLRRTKMPELSVGDFFVGAKINVFGRQFEIVDYAHETTRNTLKMYHERAFVLVQYAIREQIGLLLSAFISCNFNITRAKMVQFSMEQVKAFLEKKTHVISSVLLARQLLAGPSTGFELIGENVIQRVRECREGNKECNPQNVSPVLMKILNNDAIKAGIYSSDNDEETAQDLDFFFSHKTGLKTNLCLQNSTLAIIKPHCIKEGLIGDVITEIINNGFKITGLRMTLVPRINSEEFFDVYREVVPEYIAMVSQLSSGLCLALEVVCKDQEKNSAEEFRKVCGPKEPDVARLLRPNTLRAKFGKTKALNAVHCTDLPEDTYLELQYLFNILD